ncbi:hypothetical protein SeMB42_g01600 [Synchytrium endobioticum]|uniref:Photolyase/cryptochrome alpha/beta domain-containing protein n=1 Tax=Synchytrium endobioticum TaxID=286115 RepID=A0A507DMU0_9FUNG|nr:hypothetical protein SeMB42_g01600 [Synchytrium endobioticum]
MSWEYTLVSHSRRPYFIQCWHQNNIQGIDFTYQLVATYVTADALDPSLGRPGTPPTRTKDRSTIRLQTALLSLALGTEASLSTASQRLRNMSLHGHHDGNSKKRPRVNGNHIIEAAAKKVKADVVYTKTAGSTVIHWFRTDLRLADNTALHAATESAARRKLSLVVLWIISPAEWRNHLAASIKHAETTDDVLNLVKETCAEFQTAELHFNKEYERNESRRDAVIAAELPMMGVDVFSHHDQCVIPPGTIKTRQGNEYTVFTPFKNSWMVHLELNRDMLKPKPIPQPAIPLPDHLAALATEYAAVPRTVNGFILDTAKLERAHVTFPASEAHAQSRLANFMDRKIQMYANDRDKPFLSATSALSPYLTSGLISARQCVFQAMKKNGDQLTMLKTGAGTWISELCWRDFYRNVVVAFPRVSMNRSFKPEAELIEWRDDPVGFHAWCQGKTGFPIVDAGMRQLNETGWMHNRARMIVASFLAKDLLINWKLGENYFHEHLIDGDLASNNGGWQWSAGTGTDAQPYFRIFNPKTQSENFDPEGTYIKTYVPELASLKGKSVHDPYTALGAKGVEKIGYVKPIVDHKAARERALAAYSKAMKKV